MRHPADEPGPLVFVDDLETPELRDGDRHHLARVLRVRAGAPLTVADGAGRWRTARFGDALEVTGPVLSAPRPTPRLAVGFALVKGDKPELIVQKLTELGVDRIIPLRAERSVVRWDDAKADRALVRLRAVARAAAMQSHRPHLPEVTGVADLTELARQSGVALAERAGLPPSLERPTILVGPEGGWAPRELAQARATVALGGHVLRAETAAVTAGALLAALRAGIVRSAP